MLTKIREKPHHIKQGIALGLTVGIFSGILFIWWSSRDARSSEVKVREKTVSPVDGVAAMFSGFMDDVKEKVAGPSPVKDTTPSTDQFDLSGVVVIDPTATSSGATSTSVTKAK